MGKRDDRLHSAETYKAVLTIRPVVKTGSCVVYKAPSPDGMRLGFVVPKKLVKYAVQRNQIKRWARALFRAKKSLMTEDVVLIVRVTTAQPKSDWRALGQQRFKQDLCLAMERAMVA